MADSQTITLNENDSENEFEMMDSEALDNMDDETINEDENEDDNSINDDDDDDRK